jgi:hypothetical protein
MRWALAAALFAALSGTAGASPTAGLWGLVTRGPIAPVCRVGTPCTGPAVGVTLVFSRAGMVRGRAVTSATGRYRVTLSPGTYSIRLAKAALGRPGFMHEPLTARVVAGRYRRVDVSIDTGIR